MRALLLFAVTSAILWSGCYENCREPNPNYVDDVPMADMTMPVLSSDGKCPENPCPSELCLDTQYFEEEMPNRCVPENRIIYVDNNNPKPGIPDGTQSKPYTDINAALNAKIAAKPYILVRASTKNYGPVLIDLPQDATGTKAIIGPWANPAFTTRDKSTSVNSWLGSKNPYSRLQTITVTSGKLVYIDGFDIDGEQRTETGVRCYKSEMLLVQRSRIRNHKNNGVEFKLEDDKPTLICKNIVVNRAYIVNNNQGIYVSMGTAPAGTTRLSVYNSFVGYNGSNGLEVIGGGIWLLIASYNTIVENGGMGISCVGIPSAIAKLCGSLLIDNPRRSGTSDMGVQSQIACGSYEGRNREILTAGGYSPEFEDLNYEGILKADSQVNKNLLIDQMPSPNCSLETGVGVSLGSIDFLGTSRPQGAGPDYGMHEVWQAPVDGGVTPDMKARR